MLQASNTPDTGAIALEHTEALHALLSGVDSAMLDRIVSALAETRDAGGTIFVAGNGGSATTAGHLVCDLGKATRHPDRPRMRVVGLADNTAWFSALSNDEGYERSFSGQLENFARPGDLLLVISASGNSPNLLSAVSCAQELGATTVGLLGFDGGALLDMVDLPLLVESERGLYAEVEDAHSALCHVLTKCLSRR
jgi:D-sedoheptulose 7-phosphate isomerase